LERLAPAPDRLALVCARTPARLLVGRAGPAYRTATYLQLRSDHAAARDAISTQLNLTRDLGEEFVRRWQLFEVASQAADQREFLLRPDRGRRLSDAARAEVARLCPRGAELQIVIGDGLSAAAVVCQVPTLLPLLSAAAEQSGLSLGRAFLIRHCRVGVLNDIGELLDPSVVVLLIGERPGLATAESLSAYLAYRPRHGHTDARRNLISNIHRRGVSPESAARRIVALAHVMRARQQSGVEVKEELAAALPENSCSRCSSPEGA
jgi:ethanolamine ammonia-lyase small subunit